MKTEPKTLKDLTSWICECNCVTFDNEICRSCGKRVKYGVLDYEDLRKEAIKWVKEDLERLRLKNDFGDYIWDKPIHYIKEWIKRFNLTKEDLK